MESIFISSLDSSSIDSTQTTTNRSQRRKLLEESSKYLNKKESGAKIRGHPKPLNSDEFNFWFECLSFSTGRINLDIALDAGEPAKQFEFLRIHDAYTRRIYFLWSTEAHPKCGCLGGCSFYSVFTENTQDNIYNLDTSIARTNKDFAQSLFYPGMKMLESAPIMKRNYQRVPFKFQVGTDSSSPGSSESERMIIEANSGKIKPYMSQISLRSLGKNINGSQRKLNAGSASRLDFSSASSSSLASSVRTIYVNNEDDYYTADEEDEEDAERGLNGRKKRVTHSSSSRLSSAKSSQQNLSNKISRPTRFSLKSAQSKNSKTSFVSVRTQIEPKLNEKDEDNNNNDDDDEDDDLTLNENTVVPNQTTKPEDRQKLEPEMTLKFDIQRPILDSVLPKYCYLKYLSRASVSNWNRTVNYPCYEETKNISFEYRQRGFGCGYVSATPRKESAKSKREDRSEIHGASDLKCRVNLEFTNSIEGYITPLALTALERFVRSMKNYQLSPNNLVSKLQSKAEAHFDSDSLIDVIAKTQVSMNIPQVLLCSLQCGLAEGDKVANAFSNTLARPDDFITLSLFTICVHALRLELIDSQDKAAAIFTIDRVESQFSRLFEPQALANSVGLSCIADKHSKVSITCFEGSESYAPNDKFHAIRNAIMCECAFEHIGIKAVKRSAEEKRETSGLNEKSKQDGDAHSRLSLCEFQIDKIWFSFPEPPVSPKGRRKIPYTRFDWNLLSSVSPAVTSWLCASKHALTPIHELTNFYNRRLIQSLVAVIAGALRSRESLEQRMDTYRHFSLTIAAKEGVVSKGKKKNNGQPAESLLRDYKRAQTNLLNLYLTNHSFSLLNEPNLVLVNLLRNYYYFFEEEFCSDMQKAPEPSYLKKVVGEALGAWWPIIVGYLERKNSQSSEKYLSKDEFSFSMLNDNPNYFTLSESGYPTSPNTAGFTGSESTLEMSPDEADDKLKNKEGPDNNEKTAESEKALKMKNVEKIFKPFLSFVGMDVPSGKFVDNLFKEFGSFLHGNLHIKSVDINILGKPVARPTHEPNEEHLSKSQVKFRSFMNKAQAGFDLTGGEKVITTILSFDRLLLNLSIRQVMPERVTDTVETLKSNENAKDQKISVAKSVKSRFPKYYAKIDANMQLNNLTQEVNMPLLRLVHQLYSIVEDAIDYDKEQSKLLVSAAATRSEEPVDDALDNDDTLDSSELFGPRRVPLSRDLTFDRQLDFAPIDCWRFIDERTEIVSVKV